MGKGDEMKDDPGQLPRDRIDASIEILDRGMQPEHLCDLPDPNGTAGGLGLGARIRCWNCGQVWRLHERGLTDPILKIVYHYSSSLQTPRIWKQERVTTMAKALEEAE